MMMIMNRPDSTIVSIPNAVCTSLDESSPDETSHANQGTTGMLAPIQLTPALVYIAVLKAYHRFHL